MTSFLLESSSLEESRSEEEVGSETLPRLLAITSSLVLAIVLGSRVGLVRLSGIKLNKYGRKRRLKAQIPEIAGQLVTTPAVTA